MSNSLNTTGNKFYDTVNFDKGSQAKGLLLPTENGKADLGSSSNKFDNVYANNISGGAKFTEGTWGPQVQWSSNQSSIVRPTFPTPTTTVLAAGYKKIGKKVYLFYVFRADKPASGGRFLVYGFIKNIPFSFYQRVPFVNNWRQNNIGGSPINTYHYSSHGSAPALYWDGAYQGSIGYSLTKRTIALSLTARIFSLRYEDSSPRYYYASFSYWTQT